MHPNHLSDTFLQEADDLLSRIEDCVLDLGGADSDNPDKIHELFRAFHTIKGSAAMFGFDAVSSFTHHVENTLDRVRNRELTLTTELLETILSAKDHIKVLLECGSQGNETADRESNTITARLAASGQNGSVSCGPATRKPGRDQAWSILFRPDPTIMLTGGNPVLVIQELLTLGTGTVHCHMDDVPVLSVLEPDRCYLYWTVELTTSATLDAIRDIFLFVEEGSEIRIERASAGVTVASVDSGATASAPTPAAAATASKARKPESTVRVPSAKLDQMVNLVGELVMNQSRLTQAASRSDDPALSGPVEEIERLVAELRESVLGIRMMPIGATFSRFRRLVHDLSAELGKHIELVTEGAETELDKTMLDQLGEPLVHLIRNSIDHGIEPAGERIGRGKPERGTIRLTAVHTGSNVVIRIQDDGRGLDLARIRSKAVQQHLIPADANLTDKEICNLIFLPGFSTAREVTSVSGRGVGMDVVRRQIESLSGAISVSTEAGNGTTISLTLPLTLAIIDGLLIEAGGEQFIVPMPLVTENVELQQVERQRNNGRNVVAVRGELVPYITLRDAFSTPGERPALEKIVIIRHDDQRVGLVVDRVIGTHQTVIQSLGTSYRDVPSFSGATIMADGRVALILDVAGLIRAADQPARSGSTRALSTQLPV